MTKRRYTWEFFPFRLFQCRTLANLTHAELARRAGISPSTVAAYERGECSPTLHRLDALAEALGASIDWLLGRCEFQPGPQDETADF